MSTKYPSAGPLSQMAITGLATGAVLVIGFALPAISTAFTGSVTPRLLDLFLISTGLLALHKFESYITGEFDQCPVYITLSQKKWASSSRRIAFVVFASTLLGGLFLIQLVLRGSPWILLLLLIWNAHGIHELHHLAKSAARKRYYPGTSTAVAFTVFIDSVLFPEWYALVELRDAWVFYGYYALQPIALLAFYFEDRIWFRKASFIRAAAIESASRTGRSGIVTPELPAHQLTSVARSSRSG